MTDFAHDLPDGFIEIHAVDDEFPVAQRVADITSFCPNAGGGTLLYLRDNDEPFLIADSTLELSAKIAGKSTLAMMRLKR